MRMRIGHLTASTNHTISLTTNMSNQQLVVLDFDWSLADQDCETWIFEVLAPDLRRKIQQLMIQGGIQWTDLVAQTMREAQARGITKEQIIGALQIIPFHPAMIRAVKNLKAEGKTTFICVSGANSTFISTILESKGLENLFQEIITNPSEWDPSGLLKMIDPAGPQHMCKVGVCDPNLCKGEELDAFLKRQAAEYGRIIYVGDSMNDFCPILRLRSQDLVLCRSYPSRALKKCIEMHKEAHSLKCSIRYWAEAWEVEEMFNEL